MNCSYCNKNIEIIVKIENEKIYPNHWLCLKCGTIINDKGKAKEQQ